VHCVNKLLVYDYGSLEAARKQNASSTVLTVADAQYSEDIQR